jgi:hypothetical protein
LSSSLFEFAVYKEGLAGGKSCVNAGAMLWKQAERWAFGQSSSMMMLCDLNSRRLALSPFGARSSSRWNGYLSHAGRVAIHSHCTRHEMAWHGRLQRHQTGCYIVQSSISFVCELNSMPVAIEPRLSIINCSLFELQGCIIMIKCRQCQPVIGLGVFACNPERKAESCYSLITHH